MAKIAACARLDRVTDQDLDKLIKFVSKYEKSFIYQEVAAKTKKVHWHAYIPHETEKEYNAAKERYRVLFKGTHCSDQRSYPLDRTGRGGIYATKDGNCVFKKGYTDEEIAIIQSQSYQKKEKVCLWKEIENSFYENVVLVAETEGILVTDSDVLDYVYSKYSMGAPWSSDQVAKLIRYLLAKYKHVMMNARVFEVANKEAISQLVWGNTRAAF